MPAADVTTCDVLLVEDDPDVRYLMSQLLEGIGCEVRAAASAAEALTHLRGTLPTHVLLDLMLPDADGTLVLGAIRREHLPLRVAVVSAAGPGSAIMSRAARLAPDAFFHKPITFAEIARWLRAS